MAELDLKEKLEQQEIEDDLEKQKDDICPYCGLRTGQYPYIIFERFHGWLECTGCGIVFSPLSIRRKKLEELTKMVKTPSLVVPASE